MHRHHAQPHPELMRGGCVAPVAVLVLILLKLWVPMPAIYMSCVTLTVEPSFLEILSYKV
jgi:hypothetical protein